MEVSIIPRILEMRAAGGQAVGGRLQGLCCAALFFIGTLFLQFCDMSNLKK